jgi:hypothetical protein
MVSLGIISIPAKYKMLKYAVFLVENEDMFYQAWKGLEATWYALMERWKTCPMSKSAVQGVISSPFAKKIRQ